MSEFVADVGALIDASGAQRVHLVGHDWGAAVAWNVADRMPDRLASLSPISVPHPVPFAQGDVDQQAGAGVVVHVLLPIAAHPRAASASS